MAASVGDQSSQSFTTGNTLSFPHTVEANCQLLVVRYAIWCSTANDPGAASGTYAGVSLTEIVSRYDASRHSRAGILALLNPAKGANTLAVSWARTDVNGVFYASDILGASKMPINGNSAGGNSTTASVAITGLGGYLVLDVLENPGAMTSQTTQDWTWSNVNMASYGSHKDATGASQTMSYTVGSPVFWNIAGCAIEPDMVGAPCGTTPFMTH